LYLSDRGVSGGDETSLGEMGRLAADRLRAFGDPLLITFSTVFGWSYVELEESPKSNSIIHT
jgi:hypothetical protein